MLMSVPALANPQFKLEALLGQLETAVALLDRSGVLVYANPAFCEMFAVSPSRSHGLPLFALGEPARVFVPLAERVRAGATSVRLRGQTLETRSGRSLQADIGVSLWTDESVLLEIHELGADIRATPTA